MYIEEFLLRRGHIDNLDLKTLIILHPVIKETALNPRITLSH